MISRGRSPSTVSRWCADEPAGALQGQDVYAAYAAAGTAEFVVRKLAVQFLAAGSHPNIGQPLIAQLLADVSTGDTTTLDQLDGANLDSLASTSQEPQIQASKKLIIHGVYCGTFGPLNDYGAANP